MDAGDDTIAGAAEPEVAAAAAPESPEPMGVFQDSRVGRAVISGLMALLVTVLVGWNIPASGVRDELRSDLRPLVNTLGMNQGWEVFSPNPSTTSINVVADVTFANGDRERFEFPGGEPVLGALRQYRWRKWERRIRLEKHRRLWRPTTDWIAREMAQPGNPVVTVILVRDWSRTPAPGSGDDRTWQEVEFFTAEYEAEP